MGDENNSHSDINPLNDKDPMPSWGWGEPGGPYLPDNPSTT
jgi:hemoglobin